MSLSANDCRANGAGLAGKGLRRPRPFARHIRLRHGPLFDRPDRFAGDAVEHEQESLLRRLRDDVPAAPVVSNRQELGSDRQIVVPDIVVDDLIVPEALAGPRIERDQAVREQILTGPVAAVEVEPSGPERHVRDAARLVDRQLAPVVDAAMAGARVFRPRVRAGIAVCRAANGRPSGARPSARRTPARRRDWRRIPGAMPAGSR